MCGSGGIALFVSDPCGDADVSARSNILTTSPRESPKGRFANAFEQTLPRGKALENWP